MVILNTRSTFPLSIRTRDVSPWKVNIEVTKMSPLKISFIEGCVGSSHLKPLNFRLYCSSRNVYDVGMLSQLCREAFSFLFCVASLRLCLGLHVRQMHINNISICWNCHSLNVGMVVCWRHDVKPGNNWIFAIFLTLLLAVLQLLPNCWGRPISAEVFIHFMYILCGIKACTFWLQVVYRNCCSFNGWCWFC